MRQFVIIAHPEYEEMYLPRREKVIMARDREDAINTAWREFPEYHEVSAYEVE